MCHIVALSCLQWNFLEACCAIQLALVRVGYMYAYYSDAGFSLHPLIPFFIITLFTFATPMKFPLLFPAYVFSSTKRRPTGLFLFRSDFIVFKYQLTIIIWVILYCCLWECSWRRGSLTVQDSTIFKWTWWVFEFWVWLDLILFATDV